jgi:putative transposase
MFVARREQKAPARVEKVNPAYTSQTGSACRTRDRNARESQAVFRCRSCGYASNADVNAVLSIAAGHTVRGAPPLGGASNREPLTA